MEQDEEEIWTLVQIEGQLVASLETCDTIASANLCFKSYTNYLIKEAIRLEQKRSLSRDELMLLSETTDWEETYFGGCRK